MEERVNYVLKGGILSNDDYNLLLQDLSYNRETNALIRVYDMKQPYSIQNETWKAMSQLHNLGKGKIPDGTISLPYDRNRLAPARRLHKIFKGRILSDRSKKADEYIADAVKCVNDYDSILTMTPSQRIGFLKGKLNVSDDVARGLITKLKRKKMLK